MDNSSYRNLYIAHILEQPNMSPEYVQRITNLWKRVSRFEAEYKKSIDDGYTKDDYVQLLAALNIRNISGFLSTKSLIRKYVEKLIEDGHLPLSSLNDIVHIGYDDLDAAKIFELKFFKDFESLQDAIQTTLVVADKVDERIFSTQIAAIYMAWCGLKLEDALRLKKEDVKENSIQVGDKEIFPNPTIMEFMKDYRDATEYQSAAKGIITLKYVPSDWLFRSTKSDHIDSPKTMRIFIRNFGKSAGGDNIFNYDKVYLSGLYHRAYLYECVNGTIKKNDTETISKVFEENYARTSLANNRLQSYRKFVQYFFPTR